MGNNPNGNRYAVLVPVVNTETGPAFLMEVRSDKVKQPGEICFPGGRMEGDETAAETALRETCEELGICSEDIRILGELDKDVMDDGRIVYPVAAGIDPAMLDSLILSTDEVKETFLLPLEWLRQNQAAYYDLAETDEKDLPERLRNYLSHYGIYRRRGATYYWEYDGRGIWGLTARIIRRCLLY